jgi:hypothetical protein
MGEVENAQGIRKNHCPTGKRPGKAVLRARMSSEEMLRLLIWGKPKVLPLCHGQADKCTSSGLSASDRLDWKEGCQVIESRELGS